MKGLLGQWQTCTCVHVYRMFVHVSWTGNWRRRLCSSPVTVRPSTHSPRSRHSRNSQQAHTHARTSAIMSPPDLSIWLSAPRIGKPLTGFIPLKTPIDWDMCGDASKFSDEFKEEHDFSVSMFMERQLTEERSVGLVVDLTTPQSDGRRLYDTDEWNRDWDVEYLALPCAPPLPEGEAAPAADWSEPVPSEEMVHGFIGAVARFWAQPQNQRRHVAVHCVTGINVAGFMIARFLARNAPVGRVLAAYSRHRPPGIYSPDLLEAVWHAGLMATPSGGGPKPSATDGGWVQPHPPTWHPLVYRAVDRSAAAAAAAKASAAIGGVSSSCASSSSSMSRPAVPRFAEPGAGGGTMSAPGATSSAATHKRPAPSADADAHVPPPKKAAAGDDSTLPLGLRSVGRLLPEGEAAPLFAACERLIGVSLQGEGGGGEAATATGRLPGYSHGEVLRRADLEAMGSSKGDGWLVTWKAEGERVVLMVQADEGDGSGGACRSVLFDARGRAWQLQSMQWPKTVPQDGSGGSTPHSGLVIAGELVCDVEKPGAPPVWRLLCYDLLAMDGKSLKASPLHKRMGLLGAQALNPRKHPAFGKAVASEVLRVRQKDCFRLKHVPHVLRKLTPGLFHKACGLVFLQAEAPVASGLTPTAKDWKRDAVASAGAGEYVDEAELLRFAEAHFK